MALFDRWTQGARRHISLDLRTMRALNDFHQRVFPTKVNIQKRKKKISGDGPSPRRKDSFPRSEEVGR